MKEFWKDYKELCKDTGRFYKKHWKGVVVLNAAIIGAEVVWYKYKAKQFERLIGNCIKEDEAQ